MSELTVQNVINIAEKEIGYYEKASNYNLYEKDSNKGSRNYTKYNYELVQKIGGPYANPAAWCDMFVDWVICKAVDWDIERAKKALNGFSAYCPTSAQFYRNANRWSNKPIVGAQFFTGSKGHENHTGLVYKVISNNVFETIEGNYGNKVSVVKRYVSQCSGFGIPDYDNLTYVNTYDVVIKTNQVEKGSYGNCVKTIQRIYNSYFTNENKIEEDGICGEKTVKAIKELQKEVGVVVDGICGENTWNGIINKL